MRLRGPVGFCCRILRSVTWTFRNSQTPVQVVFENLEDGMSIDEIIEQYPVSREAFKAVLGFAAQSLDRDRSCG